MSDWTMQARNAIEEQLQAVGYRVMYDYTCRYTTYVPQPDRQGRSSVYYGTSLDDAWTAAYKDFNRGGVAMNEYLYPYTDETPVERKIKPRPKYYIWWLSQASSELMGLPAVFDDDKEQWGKAGITLDEADYFWREKTDLPDYIFNQLLSRYGRPGRGRLWVDRSVIGKIDDLDADNAESDPVRAMTVRETDACGGIVILAQDLKFVRKYPGFITDLEYNKI